MKTNRTELVFILDKSGSMQGLESDTVGGYNSFLEKQKQIKGDATITTVLFNERSTLLHDRIDIKAVQPITLKEYQVGGCTALVDAIGSALHKIESVQSSVTEEFRADKVLFVIITDGLENASREYTADQIKTKIKRHSEEGWEFIFLGANIDAVETGECYGIPANRALNYQATHEGTAVLYEAVCCAAASFREDEELSDEWGEDIESHFGG